VNYRQLSEVRDEIYNEIKNQRFAEWMGKLNRETTVQANPAFARVGATGQELGDFFNLDLGL